MAQEMLGFNVTYGEGPGTVDGALAVRGWVWVVVKLVDRGVCGKRTLEEVIMRKNAQ